SANAGSTFLEHSENRLFGERRHKHLVDRDRASTLAAGKKLLSVTCARPQCESRIEFQIRPESKMSGCKRSIGQSSCRIVGRCKVYFLKSKTEKGRERVGPVL